MAPNELIAVESRLAALWRDGQINALTHFSGGNEHWLCRFYDAHVSKRDWVLASHRAHYHALLSGMTEEELARAVLEGRSMFLYGERFITSAIVAGVCGIAAGLALSIKRRNESNWVWCFVGDGASEQGGFYEAVRFVDGRDLPCTFIIENNNSSCGVTMQERGIKPFAWPDCVIEYHYQSTYPHAGTVERPILKSLSPKAFPS